MRLIFCLPGRQFSHHWVRSWTDTVSVLSQQGIEWGMSMAYDPVVYYARNRVLGGNNTQGRDQKPFGGQLHYDYQIWIDSDMVWKPSDVLALIRHDKPIVSGCYLMANAQEFPIVEHLDYDQLLAQGTFKFMNREELSARHSAFAVSYVGFGFVAVAQGVMERMQYPWFRPRWVDRDPFLEFTAEDVGFCWTAAELGQQIWVDPSIRVGHEKSLVIG